MDKYQSYINNQKKGLKLCEKMGFVLRLVRHLNIIYQEERYSLHLSI